MVLFIRGMPCALTGKPILAGDDYVGFPPFVANTLDPMHVFSDAVVLRDAYDRHPLKMAVERRLQAYRHAAVNRVCRICSDRIVDPDDWFGVGHLTDDGNDAARLFNHAQYHRRCLAFSAEAAELLDVMRQLRKTGVWAGAAIDRAIDCLGDLAPTWQGKDSIIDDLKELSARDMQERLWLSDGAQGEVSSYVEAVERLFTDSGLGRALEKGRTGLTDGVNDRLRKLSDLLRRIDGNRSPADIIADPMMVLVRDKAAELLAMIDG